MASQPELPRARERVYIETTIASYLTSRRSRDDVVRGHQETTRRWWADRRAHFELVTSQHVIREAKAGDRHLAIRRVALLEPLQVVDISDRAVALAAGLVRVAAMPPQHLSDALHIALSAAHGVDYLLTWNCRHIANATTRARIEAECRAHGFEPPVLCTPEELMG